MTQEKSGFLVRYESARALLRDHGSFFAQGGMIVPWRAPAPPLSTPLTIRIQAPDGTLFDVSAKSAQSIPEHGFMVVFDPVAENRARSAFDMFMKGALFKRSLEKETPSGTPPSAMVTPFGSFVEAQKRGVGEESTEPLPMVLEPPPEAPDTDDITGTDPLEAGSTDEASAEAPEGSGEAEEQTIEILPEGFSLPGPGESYPSFVIRYQNVKDFVEVGEAFKNEHRLRFPYEGDLVKAGTVAEVRLTLPGHTIYKMWGIVETSSAERLTVHFDENNATYRKAATYLDSSQARHRMKNEASFQLGPPIVTRLTEKMPLEDPNKMPIRRRLQRMGMEDKINMALSGGKEERMALAMDGNKAIHHYLLRNAKISLDEIAFMARLPTMNPDVLEKIAENPSYTQNPSVVKALVYNPKTPTPTAIRLLDRLPRQEVVNLAKRTNMNLRLVMAAKKKIEGRRI